MGWKWHQALCIKIKANLVVITKSSNELIGEYSFASKKIKNIDIFRVLIPSVVNKEISSCNISIEIWNRCTK